MRSKIYAGFVEHTRFRPAHHALKYSLFVYCLDLQELEALDEDLPLFGYNRFSLASIHDGDYLDASPGSIREKVLRRLGPGLAARVERVFLLTQPRFLTAVFNPVSFYYCFDAKDDLVCCVAEVNNTFGERHVYVLAERSGSGKGFPAAFPTDKAFHVSPFNRVDGSYVLTFSELGNTLDISVDLLREGERFFTARLTGREMPLTTLSQLRLTVLHPLVPRLTMARIYWEAAKLYFLKGLAYNPKPVAMSPMTIRRNPPGLVERVCLKAVDRLLRNMDRGRLRVELSDGSSRTYGPGTGPLAEACIRVNDPALFSRVALHGEVGLGEAYVEGLWDSDDLAGVMRLLVANRTALAEGNMAVSALSRWRNFRLHLNRPNTLTGSRDNIEAHYDLSAEFYRTFLGETMTYSCALFAGPGDSLEQAQRAKLRSVIDKARIRREHHVLEIGCGWGSLAVQAVRETGCRWTGITISRTQYEYARSLVQREGLEDRITIVLEDYRTVRGSFDRIVSVEMIEAVGHEHLGEFFSCCDRLLRPDGIMCIQSITIPDSRYDDHRSQPNWIQKHIFPGGVLPSLTALCSAMTARSGLLVESAQNIGPHYAETLKRWRERLAAAAGELASMGFDRAFQRRWQYYFALCEAQFGLRVLNDLQLVLVREGNAELMGIGPAEVPAGAAGTGGEG